LAEACGVSRRTVHRDFRTLSECGIPVQYDSASQGYFLPRRSYLPAAELTVEETLALVALGHGLADEERGLPLQRAARRAIEKLGTQLPRALHAHLGDEPERGDEGSTKPTRGPRPTDDASAIEVRLEPRNTLAGRQDVYDELVDAARRRVAVRIEYRSLSPAETIVTKLSPYRLLFSRRSWYVIGRSSVHRSVRTFNVGRIETLARLEDTFVIPPRFSVARHIGNAWHMIREKPRNQRVVIRFDKLVADNVAEVRWHKTQSITRHADGAIDFEVVVDGLREISWWILGYGDQAEVVSPPELREMIAERVSNMARRYQRGA
jgi:proteasome accessory factor B